MLAVSHAITGAAIAHYSPTPILGFFLAFLSHPILDLIPHWDFNSRHNGRNASKTIVISAIDAAAGFSFGFILFGTQIQPLILLTTMFIAQLPDWIEAPYHILNWRFPPFSTIKQIQHKLHIKLRAPWGVLTQILLILSLLAPHILRF